MINPKSDFFPLPQIWPEAQMPLRPPVPELEFLSLVPNHGEMTRKLAQIKVRESKVSRYAKYICKCWFDLGDQHMIEAKKLISIGCSRSVYSRSYYAAYNVSKAIRYLVNGKVSLKGDDHGSAPNLPTDFNDLADWSRKITILYEHRLRADYDNWGNTQSLNTQTPIECLQIAENFIQESRSYLYSKFGLIV